MKTVCVYHSIDLDGWMSAAIVKHWFLNDRDGIDPKYRIVFEEGNGYVSKSINGQGYSLDFIGYNYGQPIPDLLEYDRVIMCDISFPKDVMKELYISGKLTWIDHHISAINDYKTLDISFPRGLQDTKYAACELTWKFFFTEEPMPEIVRLLGRYDCFGHKGTSEEQMVLEFQYGARQYIGNYEEAYGKLQQNLSSGSIIKAILQSGESIYQYLCTEAKQVYKNGFTIKFIDEITDDKGKNIIRRKFICINKERFNPINFGIDYHKDGYDGCACFHYDGKQWSFSLYNDNGEVDCSVIAKQYGGGGHKGAAGFKIDDINKIIK